MDQGRQRFPKKGRPSDDVAAQALNRVHHCALDARSFETNLRGHLSDSSFCIHAVMHFTYIQKLFTYVRILWLIGTSQQHPNFRGKGVSEEDLLSTKIAAALVLITDQASGQRFVILPYDV